MSGGRVLDFERYRANHDRRAEGPGGDGAPRPTLCWSLTGRQIAHRRVMLANLMRRTARSFAGQGRPRDWVETAVKKTP
jgi:hypothetical protein